MASLGGGAIVEKQSADRLYGAKKAKLPSPVYRSVSM